MHGVNNLFLFLNRILGNGHGVKVSRLQIWKVPVYWSSILFVWVHVQYQLIDTYWKKIVYLQQNQSTTMSRAAILLQELERLRRNGYSESFLVIEILVFYYLLSCMFLLRMQFFFYYLFKYFPRFDLFGRKKINWNLLWCQGCFKQCGMYQTIDG